MTKNKHQNPTRIFLWMVVACIIVFLAGCYGELNRKNISVSSPTPSVFLMNSPAVAETHPVAATATLAVPTASQNTALPPLRTIAPPPSIGKLVENVLLSNLQVFTLFEGDSGNVQEQPCSFSTDNFYTCVVGNHPTPAIRIRFTLNNLNTLSKTDLERIASNLEMVVYPYWMISRYTTAPPLVDANILEWPYGEWYTDFEIESPYQAFTFYLLAEGQSLIGANLYLKPLVPGPAAALPVENEDD